MAGVPLDWTRRVHLHLMVLGKRCNMHPSSLQVWFFSENPFDAKNTNPSPWGIKSVSHFWGTVESGISIDGFNVSLENVNHVKLLRHLLSECEFLLNFLKNW